MRPSTSATAAVRWWTSRAGSSASTRPSTRRGRASVSRCPATWCGASGRQLRSHGRVIRGYLGVSTEDVVQIVGEEVAGEPPAGARVVSVRPDSPAAGAGLAVGDIVVGFAGRPVESHRRPAVPGGGHRAGHRGRLRRGARRAAAGRCEVGLVEWTEAAAAVPGAGGGRWLGLEVASLDGDDPRVRAAEGGPGRRRDHRRDGGRGDRRARRRGAGHPPGRRPGLDRRTRIDRSSRRGNRLSEPAGRAP